MSLAGCDKGPPKGQVIALVDGQEVTLSELNYESRIRGLRLEGDPALRQAVLKELVDRKLLVREAQRRRLEKRPDFILAERRGREIALAQTLLADRPDAAVISGAEVRRFIAGHPLAFGKRVTASVDQLRFSPVSPGLREQLGRAKSVDAMLAILRSAGIEFRRTSETWDSADPSSPLAERLLDPREGQLFLLEGSGEAVAGILIQVTPQPVPPAQQDEFARALIQRAASERHMHSLLEHASKQAKVSYQDGFGP